MRLRRIELLCLRAADGLASERDLKVLKAAGIDPNDWINLPGMLRNALIDPRPVEFSAEVCKTLNLRSLPIAAALKDPQPVSGIAAPVMQELTSVVSSAGQEDATSIANDQAVQNAATDFDAIAEAKEETSSLVSTAEDIVTNEITEDVESVDSVNMVGEAGLSEKVDESEEITLDMLASLEAELPLGDILKDEQSVDLLSGIMNEVAPQSEFVESDDVVGEEIYVLDNLVEEPLVTQEEVRDIEEEMDISLGEVLKPLYTPNIVDSVMSKVTQLGVPQPHLRLVSTEESSNIEVQENIEESSGGVHVEIQEIRSPVDIDGDSTIVRLTLYGASSLFAIAAAWLFWVSLGLNDIDPTNVQEPLNQSSTAQLLDDNSQDDDSVEIDFEIVDIDSDANIQILQADEDSATIIIIEDFEGE
jgi:hypothetical protein